MTPEPRKRLSEKWSYVFSPQEAKGVGFLDRLALTFFGGAQDIWQARYDDPKERLMLEMLAGLAQQRGISAPNLVLYKDGSLNARSLSWSGSIAVSADLAENMPPEQVRAVLAHELAHHRHRLRDFVLSAGGLFGLATLYEKALKPHVVDKLRPQGRVARMAFKAVESVGWVAGGFEALAAYQRACEYESDREAAALTDPRDNINALETLLHRTDTAEVQESLRVQQKRLADRAHMPAWQQLVADTMRQMEPDWIRRVRRHPLSAIRTHPPAYARIARLEHMEKSGQADAPPKAASIG